MTETEQIRDAVLAHFLDTGRSASAPEIAARLSWPMSKVRKIIAANFGSVPDTDAARVSKPTYSKNYPSMAHGTAVVWTWAPTTSFLRAQLLAALGRPDPLKKHDPLAVAFLTGKPALENDP